MSGGVGVCGREVLQGCSREKVSNYYRQKAMGLGLKRAQQSN